MVEIAQSYFVDKLAFRLPQTHSKKVPKADEVDFQHPKDNKVVCRLRHLEVLDWLWTFLPEIFTGY